MKNYMTNFQELGASQPITKALQELGITEPTDIQAKAIPLALKKQDLIGQAKTGTGKTLAFGIPVLENIAPEQLAVQALILVPTRELALQVAKSIQAAAKYCDARVLAVYGGEDIEKQIRELSKGVHVVVGTPGRILDHLERGTINFSRVNTVVLDEADRMLDMGFIDDIKAILARTPKEKQTMLFSATLPGPILEIAEKYMKQPVEVRVSEDKLTVEEIKQYYLSVDAREKPDAVATILKHARKPLLAIVFCRTKLGADRIEQSLRARGFNATALHGNLTQARREQVMQMFRKGETEILVATDLAARGLDIPNISLVINYDLPEDRMTYVHRIGRTARAGRKGEAVTLVSNVAEIRELRMIARMANAEIQPLSMRVERFPVKHAAHQTQPRKQGTQRPPTFHSRHATTFHHRIRRRAPLHSFHAFQARNYKP
ncbi:MAG: DEAD/DEAH box helicase [Candidatus Micrarchaeia archaeon]